MNGENIMSYIGLAQILSLYTEVSLLGQGAAVFPTTVIGAICDLRDQLEEWSEEWQWSEEDVPFLQTAPPAVLIEYMESEALFKPKLSKNVLLHYQRKVSTKRKQQHKRLFYLRAGGCGDDDLDTMGVKNSLQPDSLEASDDHLDVNLIFDGSSFDSLKKVENYCKKISKSLHTAISSRIKLVGLIGEARNTFHENEWVESQDAQETAKKHITELLKHVDDLRRGKFQSKLEEICSGFLEFSKFSLRKQRSGEKRIEKIYKSFFDSKFNSNQEFCEFFEFIQVRSYR